MPPRDFQTERILEERPWTAEPLHHLDRALKHYVLQAGVADPAEAHRQALRCLDDALALAFRTYLIHHDEAAMPQNSLDELRAAETCDFDRLLELITRYGPPSCTQTAARHLAAAHGLRLAAERDPVQVARSMVESTADLAVEIFRDLFGLRVGFRHQPIDGVLAGTADSVGRLSLAESIALAWSDARTRPSCLIAGAAVVLLTLVYIGGLAAILLIR